MKIANETQFRFQPRELSIRYSVSAASTIFFLDQFKPSSCAAPIGRTLPSAVPTRMPPVSFLLRRLFGFGHPPAVIERPRRLEDQHRVRPDIFRLPAFQVFIKRIAAALSTGFYEDPLHTHLW